MTNTANTFVWYDAMTTDVKAAEAFYAKAIGWDIKDSGMPGMSYSLLSAGPVQVGGLMPIPPDAKGARPAWMGYIGVDDVDAFAGKVKAAGGAIHRPPADIPGVGRFSVAADPLGAVFVLFKGNGEAMPPAAPGTPGHIGWRELHAGDGGAAFAFYSGLFGWTRDYAHDMGPMGVYQTFAANGAQIGGMMTKMAQTPAPHWLYYFNVDDIDAAKARVEGAGGKSLMGPTEVPGGGWIVQCSDPQGAMFGMLGPKR